MNEQSVITQPSSFLPSSRNSPVPLSYGGLSSVSHLRSTARPQISFNFHSERVFFFYYCKEGKESFFLLLCPCSSPTVACPSSPTLPQLRHSFPPLSYIPNHHSTHSSFSFPTLLRQNAAQSEPSDLRSTADQIRRLKDPLSPLKLMYSPP